MSHASNTYYAGMVYIVNGNLPAKQEYVNNKTAYNERYMHFFRRMSWIAVTERATIQTRHIQAKQL